MFLFRSGRGARSLVNALSAYEPKQFLVDLYVSYGLVKLGKFETTC